jgi:hypothetical protein
LVPHGPELCRRRRIDGPELRETLRLSFRAWNERCLCRDAFLSDPVKGILSVRLDGCCSWTPGGEGEHSHGNVTMPAMPGSALVVIEAEFVFRGLETVLDRPPMAFDGDQRVKKARSPSAMRRRISRPRVHSP